MVLAELLESGGQYTAEAVLRRGGGLAEVRSALRSRFGVDFAGTSGASIAGLIERARGAIAAAEHLVEFGDVPAGGIPRSGRQTPGGRFCYRVVVEVDIGTGRRGGGVVTRREIIEVASRTSLTRDQVRESALSAARGTTDAVYLPAFLRFSQRADRIRRVRAGPILSVYRC